MQENQTSPSDAPSASHNNGHAQAGNGKANGHHEDNTPPAIRARDEVAKDKSLSTGAKWFFGFITDKTFLEIWNGDGHGRAAISQNEIRQYTGADRKSITQWTKQLADRGYVWVEKRQIPNAYPVNVYCVRALVPGRQQLHFKGLVSAWGRGRGDMGKFSPSAFSGKNGHPASQSPENPPPKAQNIRLPGGENPPPKAQNIRLPGGENGSCEAENFPMGGGGNGSGEAENFPISRGRIGPWEEEKTDHSKETPSEIRSLRVVEGAAPPSVEDLKAYKKTLARLYPRELTEKRKLLMADRAKIKADPVSYRTGPMVKSISDLVTDRKATIRKLEAKGTALTAEERARVTEYRAWLQDITDPDHQPSAYERGPLLPGPAALIDQIKAKISAIDAALR